MDRAKQRLTFTPSERCHAALRAIAAATGVPVSRVLADVVNDCEPVFIEFAAHLEAAALAQSRIRDAAHAAASAVPGGDEAQALADAIRDGRAALAKVQQPSGRDAPPATGGGKKARQQRAYLERIGRA